MTFRLLFLREYLLVIYIYYSEKMIKMKNYLSLFVLLCLTSMVFAQTPKWHEVEEASIDPTLMTQREVIPDAYRLVAVDFTSLTQFMEGAAIIKSASDFIELPMPDGSHQKFEIEESRVFSKELAAKYPQIKCFKGKALDGSGSVAHFGYTPKGFHAMVRNPIDGTMYIDRYAKNTTEIYVSYRRSDYSNQSPFECLVEDTVKEDNQSYNELSPVAGDCQLRSYRLALACTGEYAAFHGGTVDLVLAEYAVAMTRVNGIYEKDNGITMELVGNTDEVIFLDSNSDPYTNNNGGTMLGQNQTTLDNVIGTANYDIGHVFSTGGGGIASLQSPCGNGKARGVTGLGSPINDPFLVDYVCHEMGHQFGANHTQNNDCNRVGATAMEPGSASTIMGYAGICAPNVANNSDDHFHAISIQEIANFIVNGDGNDCAEYLPTENSTPQVSLASDSYTLPVGTPFVLTAIGEDADSDELTYCWEQMDNEIAVMPPSNVSTEGPAFLSLSPMISPSRYFPNLNAILTNTIPTWEVVPFVSRDMNFRCTVRDNNSAVGCTDEIDIDLTFTEDAGPFLVEYPNGGEEWDAGETETVTWDVAGTDVAPVSCDLVDIILSVDAGLTYEVVLATGVENDGSHDINVPGIQVSFARVMIRCADNVFFDISDNNFKINTPFTVVTESNTFPICEGDDLSIELSTEAFDGFDEEITFSIEDLPGTTEAIFTNNPINPSETTTLTLTNINGTEGEFLVFINAVTASISIQIPLTIIIESTEVVGFELVSPEDGLENVDQVIDLNWMAISGAESYVVTVATDPGFNDIIAIETNYEGTSLSLEALSDGTVYYWKVQVNNTCAGNPTSPIYAFQTVVSACESEVAADTPVEIEANDVSTISSTITMDGITEFIDFKVFVDVEHTWIGDLIIKLVSPSGQIFTLMDQPGVPDSQFGCESDDFTITFDDNSPNTSEDLENACENFEETYQPDTPFSDLEIGDVNGVWTLEIEDVFAQDGGALINWEIQICSEVNTSLTSLDKSILVIQADDTKTIDQDELDMLFSQADETNYVITQQPASGTLEIDMLGDGNFETLSIGTFFTQSMINASQLRYTHNGDDAETDFFRFDLVDSESKWLYNQVFDIIINQGQFFAIADVASALLCADDANATIEIQAFEGCSDYMYSIDGIEFQEEAVFTGLIAGDYTITVVDGCDNSITTNMVTIAAVSPLIVSSESDNYDILVNADGGLGGFTYSLDGVDFQSSNIFEDVENGTYTVYVQDAGGCIETSEITIDIEQLIIVDITGIDLECFGMATGIITVEASGGVQPLTYSLDAENYQDGNEFTLLNAGTYTVYVQDAGGKIVTQEVVITEPEELILSYTYANNMITINGEGGIGALTYALNSGDFSDVNEFDEYPATDFMIEVMDENGCVISTTVSPLTATVSTLDVSCFGEDDGQINIDVDGGFEAYSYSLDNITFDNISVFTDLPPGNYDIYVKDVQDNTVDILDIGIAEPDELTATSTTSGTTIVVEATGGTGDYEYNYDGGNTFTDSNIGMPDADGDITVTVRDENGCVFQFFHTFVDIQDIDDLGFEIYPNPMSDVMIIERKNGDFDQATTLDIVNNLGQLLISIDLKNVQSQSVNVADLPSGLYHIIISEGDAKAIEKLIKL